MQPPQKKTDAVTIPAMKWIWPSLKQVRGAVSTEWIVFLPLAQSFKYNTELRLGNIQGNQPDLFQTVSDVSVMWSAWCAFDYHYSLIVRLWAILLAVINEISQDKWNTGAFAFLISLCRIYWTLEITFRFRSLEAK